MKPVTLHREALEEFNDAAAHYAQISPALGQQFYAAIEQAIREVRRSPGIIRVDQKPARRHLARKFPYTIVYLERPDDLWIVAVMHLHRAPGYWRHCLPRP